MTIFYDDKAIQNHEKLLISQRRQAAQLDKAAPVVGFALSGGGIRSATFCLGMFQALSKAKDAQGIAKVHLVDYLSTVSGGGYFGAFLGRLFNRIPDVEAVLTDNQSNEIKWLRENGRYLSPNGGGDMVKLIALFLRNWISNLVVMTSLLLMAFFLLHWLEFNYVHEWLANLNWQQFPKASTQTLSIWQSNLLILPVVSLCVLTIPPGWAYWLVLHSEDPWKEVKKSCGPGATFWITPLAGLLLATGICGLMSLNSDQKVWLFGLGLCFITWMYWIIAEWRNLCVLSRHIIDNLKNKPVIASKSIYYDDAARHFLTGCMKFGFGLTLVLLSLTVLDTFSKTLAWQLFKVDYSSPVVQAWTLMTLVSSSIAPFVDRIVAWLKSKPSGGKFEVPLLWLGQLAGMLVLVLVLISLDTFSYVLLWDFPDSTWVERPQLNPPEHSLWILAGLLAFSWLFGRSWSFLNRSSLHALYSSRLTRAYLGASNPKRHQPGQKTKASVVDVLEDDDVALDDYYQQGAINAAPLHLINMTVNQTVDTESQIEQQDRKGYYLSVGPAGINLGGAINHMGGEPAPRPLPDEPAMKYHGSFKDSPCEDLSLGQTVAISGAAFSTGMGGLTGVGISLLTGFFNLRLGYWWDAYGWKKVEPQQNFMAWLTDKLAWIFPVQSYILDEYLARFHGPAKELWNLSDGGHFENMGAYELIRRQVPKIVVIDAEADPEYQFEGLGNLVRKVRIDFDAEIEFLSRDDLTTLKAPGWLGGLEDIHNKNGTAYAAIAQVKYKKSNAISWLLYVKASLTGDEPRDIQHFFRINPSFPQQSTADQFFDEAQWESYRKLGEFIGDKIFNDAYIAGQFI